MAGNHASWRARLGWALAWVFLLALSVRTRLPIAGAPAYGDEAIHYAIAKYLWSSLPIRSVITGEAFDTRPFFWGRPAFALAFGPAAHFSFSTFKAFGLLVSALIPLAAGLTVARLGARPIVAFAVAFMLSVFPAAVVWGTRVFPDALLVFPILAALVFWDRRRYSCAGLALALACFVKESALMVVAGFWVVLVLDRLLPRRTQWIPDFGAARPLAWATLVGAVFATTFFVWTGTAPGWAAPGPMMASLNIILVHVGLLPIVAYGLWRPRTRTISTITLVVVMAYVVRLLVFDGGVNGWYGLVPNVLVLCTCALLADELVSTGGVRRPIGHGIVGIVSAVFLLHTAGVAQPHAWEFQRAEIALLPNQVAFAAQEGGEPERVADAVRRSHHGTAPRVLLLDVPWFFLHYPFVEDLSNASWAWTTLLPAAENDLPLIRAAIQGHDLTVVAKYEALALNDQIVDEFRPCAIFETPAYLVLDSQGCRI